MAKAVSFLNLTMQRKKCIIGNSCYPKW